MLPGEVLSELLVVFAVSVPSPLVPDLTLLAMVMGFKWLVGPPGT